MKNWNKTIAAFLTAGILASVAALADETVVSQGAANGTAVERLKQDKAAVQTDRKQLQADRKKLREDRMKLRHRGRKHRKEEKKPEQPVAEQPKS